MNFLIDSHILIWMAEGNARLDKRMRGLLSDPTNSVYISIVSVWELSIKSKTGRLKASIDIRQMFDTCGFPLLQIGVNDVYLATSLPMFHRDPFDRMLIAQALNSNLVLVTADSQMERYNVPQIKV